RSTAGPARAGASAASPGRRLSRSVVPHRRSRHAARRRRLRVRGPQGHAGGEAPGLSRRSQRDRTGAAPPSVGNGGGRRGGAGKRRGGARPGRRRRRRRRGVGGRAARGLSKLAAELYGPGVGRAERGLAAHRDGEGGSFRGARAARARKPTAPTATLTPRERTTVKTAPASMDEFGQTLDRVVRQSRETYYDPYKLFVWPESLPADAWWMSPEL